MKGLNIDELNNLIIFGKKIAKIVYALIVVLGLYALTILVKELKILEFIFTIISILAPFFIGLIIAWLFEPTMVYLGEKGFKRIYSALLVYFIFVSFLGIMIGLLLPAISNQVDEFAKAVPGIASNIEGWIDGGLDKLGNIEGFDKEAVKGEMFSSFNEWATELPKTLPSTTINIIKSFAEGLGKFVIGLVIGFYLLISSHKTNKTFGSLLPKGMKDDLSILTTELNKSLRGFVQGTLMLSFLIFVVNYIGFSLAGLKGALIFALFCGITNVIPIVGPYIGGIPAIIVGFSQGLTVGILVLIIVVVVQFFEGNFFHPILLSKTMKLHPVTIMLGLLIFGYFWGIVGMILATPVISIIKVILRFLDTKFAILKFNG